MKKIIFVLFYISMFLFDISKTAHAVSDIVKNIGNQSISFGSSSQAQELLYLIRNNPNGGLYKITYQTPVDTVVFGCDLSTDTIIRIHQRPDGHGTSEKWTGKSIYRLDAAAKGGSLNDTPNGKDQGYFTSF